MSHCHLLSAPWNKNLLQWFFFFPGVKRFFSIGIQFQENVNTCRVKIDKMKGRRSVLNFPLTGDSRNVPWMDRPERGKHRRFLKAEWELLSALPMTTIPHFKWQNLSEIKNVHLPKFLPPLIPLEAEVGSGSPFSVLHMQVAQETWKQGKQTV